MSERIVIARRRPVGFHLAVVAVWLFAALWWVIPNGSRPDDSGRLQAKKDFIRATRPVVTPLIALIGAGLLANYWINGGLLIWVTGETLLLGGIGVKKVRLKAIVDVQLDQDNPAIVTLVMRDGSTVPMGIAATYETPEQVRTAILVHARAAKTD